MNIRIVFAVFILTPFLMQGSVRAHTPVAAAYAASLEELVADTVHHSPGLRRLQEEYEAAKARVIDAWLPRDPEVGVDVEGQPDLFRFNRRTDNEYSVTQMIPFPSKLFLRGLVASKEADIAYRKYKDKEREVIWHIEEPYYKLKLYKKTLEVSEENRGLLEQILKSAKARYESNQGSQRDLLKTQIEMSKISVEVFNLKEKIHLEEAHISHVLNKPLPTVYVFPDASPRKPFDYSLEDLEKRALEKRAELKAMEEGIERAKLGRTLAATDWLPDITVRYEGRQFRGDDTIAENDTFIGVTVPVWSLLKGVGGVWKSAGFETNAAESMYVETRNEIFLKIHEAYSRVKSSKNAIDVYENSILPQAKQEVQVLLASYEAGKADFLSLIESQKTLKEAEVEYQTALTEYEMAVSELKFQVGDDL